MTGKILFWILWPLVWLYAPLTRRVRVVIVRHSGETLLLKNWFGPGFWQLPGGGIKFGESVKQAAIREIKEELGVDLTTVSVLNAEPVLCRQFGLLMRYHYVVSSVSSDQVVKLGHDVQTYTWAQVNAKKGIATEVTQGLKLAGKA